MITVTVVMVSHAVAMIHVITVLYYSDINECDTSNGGCDHNCSNSIGSYKCSCDAGYKLADDEHSCEGIERNCLNTSFIIKILQTFTSVI